MSETAEQDSAAKGKEKYPRMQDIKTLHVGAPMLLGGKNFPDRIDVEKYPGMKMSYDRLMREAIVEWNGERAEVPMFIYKIPGVSKWSGRQPITDAPITPPAAKVTAQVSGPTHHVFQG